MRLLLDAHVLLWIIYSPSDLTRRVRDLLADQSNELVVSHATLCELLNKIGRGKLLLAGTSVAKTMDLIRALDVTFLPVDESLILAAASLPHHHSDPFDRLLIAQAIAENVTVLSADNKFSFYPIELIWQ